MPYLYEKIDGLRDAGYITEMPAYIENNLNADFELRPYQVSAFENFITYFENKKLRTRPTQTLFHMATGSGKTLIMAGLIIYLYKKGYRNFLFFVNLSNIVKKTKDNFLNKASSKYLFADEIVIDGENIPVKEVSNFQYADDSAINLCFTTTQSLHMDMWITKENTLSLDDFEETKVVLISDEAHHLNVETLQGNTSKMNSDEEESYHSWELTVRNIFEANKENVLLEFTATCDIKNPLLMASYSNKIIFDYPLYKFRADKYSKEIKTLRSDIPLCDRELQAVILSQYRLKVFQDNRILMKPIILFKAAKIAESKQSMMEFIDMMNHLTEDDIARVASFSDSDVMREAYSYFLKKGISFAELAQELREDFSEAHIISANDDKETAEQQLLLNSLEDYDNPYRAIFEVKKLDEGWDVLNLFDIVRLYETRDSRNGKPGKTTISEAQLIGRGARYCPFKVSEEQPKYQRKYDNDIENPLRICEELYYHCQNNSRYIDELKTALREVGIDLDRTVTRQYTLKEEFKKDEFYKTGIVFTNSRVIKSRKDVNGLLPSLRDKVYTISARTGRVAEDTMFDEEPTGLESSVKTYMYSTTISGIADINYAIVHKAICKFPVFKFHVLKKYFPNLKSTREFIYDEHYLGAIKLEITSREEVPSPALMFEACVDVLSKIADNISSIEETYEGSKVFEAHYIHEVFKEKKCSYINPHDGGAGVSQNDSSVPSAWKLDLSKEDWFVCEDNYGTSEEKAFVAHFKKYVDELKKEYDKVYLIRNERHLHLYSFKDGERFEPDYLLFLHSPKKAGFEQLQIFFEPKGTHLLAADAWKEEFLLELERNAVPIKKFADNNEYKIWGFHFYNQDDRSSEFKDDMDKLLAYAKERKSEGQKF